MLLVLALLIVGHALADYPLQGDFLSRAKNHKAPLAGVPVEQALIAHSVIHAGFVLVITGSLALAAAELVVHAAVDWAKWDGRFGEGERAFRIDQSIHIGCKVVWVALLGATTI